MFSGNMRLAYPGFDHTGTHAGLSIANYYTQPSRTKYSDEITMSGECNADILVELTKLCVMCIL